MIPLAHLPAILPNTPPIIKDMQIIIYSVIIRIKIRIMDIRSSSIASQEDIRLQEESKLNDTLIFNIIKKIELKMTMEDKYQEQRIPILKKMPPNLGKYIYSPLGLSYFVTIMAGMIFLKYKARRPFNLNTLLPHCVIAITLNQYERYRYIINLDTEITNQYRSYQRNAAQIIAEKKRRLSLIDIVKNSQVVTSKKLLQMLKYRPVY